jgi:plasmid maintenance system killer protein
VIDVALIGLIRRWHIRDQLSLREISRRLGISRNTVRRYIRSDITKPVYADRKSVNALDKCAFKQSTWLPPGNRLEALHGNRKGRCSIRINDQWRVCFRWADDGVYDVEIVDYH